MKTPEVFEPGKSVDAFVEHLEQTGEIDLDLKAQIEMHMGELEEQSLTRIEQAMAQAQAKKKLASETLAAMIELQAAITRRHDAVKADDSEPGFIERQTDYFLDPKVSAADKTVRGLSIASGGYLLYKLSKWITNKVRGKEEGTPSKVDSFLGSFFTYTGLAFLAYSGLKYFGPMFEQEESADKTKEEKDEAEPPHTEEQEPSSEPPVANNSTDILPSGTNLFEQQTVTIDGTQYTVQINQTGFTVNGHRYSVQKKPVGRTETVGAGFDGVFDLKFTSATWVPKGLRITGKADLWSIPTDNDKNIIPRHTIPRLLQKAAAGASFVVNDKDNNPVFMFNS